MRMTRIIASLHSKLDRGGCQWEGEGARPPLFFLMVSEEAPCPTCQMSYK